MSCYTNRSYGGRYNPNYGKAPSVSSLNTIRGRETYNNYRASVGGGCPKTTTPAAPATPVQAPVTDKPGDNGSKPQRKSIDRQMYSDLQCAHETGRGVTKAELKKIVADHANDGPKGLLTKTEQAALAKAVDKGLFATAKTSKEADRLSKGEPISLLGLRTFQSA